VLGYQVMMSDREKTALDCVEHPDLAGGGAFRPQWREWPAPES
jgi:predicted transcriptional regulator of viral defense system